jgi:hypothetical protein
MDDYRESEASRRASGWTYPPNPPDPPNPEADSMRELHKILFDAPPPPNEDPEKTRWRTMTMLKGLKAKQNEEALAALQQTAALSTCGGQTPATIEQSPPATTPPPPMAGRLGQVLGWTANIIAAGVLAIGAAGVLGNAGSARQEELIIMFGVLAAIAAAVWGVGRALRYVLTGPDPGTQWRIWHRPAGEGVSEDWTLQRRDGHSWINAAVYPTRQAAEAALRSIAG